MTIACRRRKTNAARWPNRLGRMGAGCCSCFLPRMRRPPWSIWPAIQVLRRVWLQQFYATPPDQPIRWRDATDLPPSALLICSPYDADARFSIKRDTQWTGYKVHLTETCDATRPNLITDVLTTVATTPDSVVLPAIQAALAERDLTPQEHLVDPGYVSGANLANSQADQIDLVGPARAEGGWQTRIEAGLTAAQFAIDWATEQVQLPGREGQRALVAQPGTDGTGADQRTVCRVRLPAMPTAGAVCGFGHAWAGHDAVATSASTKRCRRPAHASTPTRTKRTTRRVRALRARSAKAAGWATCIARAIGGWQKQSWCIF